MAKEPLKKICPKCSKSNLMSERWGEYNNVVEYRITCSDLSCSYEPIHVNELKKYESSRLAH